RVYRIEFEHLDSAVAKSVEKRRWRVEGADAVVDDVDLDAGGLAFQQQVGELPAGLIVLENVGFQVDVVPGRANGGEHCAVSRGAVLQQRELVAQHQRAVNVDGLLVGQMLLQHIGGAVLTLQPLENGIASCR